MVTLFGVGDAHIGITLAGVLFTIYLALWFAFVCGALIAVKRREGQ